MAKRSVYAEAMRRAGHPLMLVKSEQPLRPDADRTTSGDERSDAAQRSKAATVERGERTPQTIKSSARPSILIGYGVIALLLLGLGGWAATAPLSSAAIAPGVVTVEGNRKTVQHLEGGIVRRILVADGSEVAAGQPLIELDDTVARADFGGLDAQRCIWASQVSRLRSEFNRDTSVKFPPWLEQRTDDPIAQAAMQSERGIFRSRRAMLDEHTSLTRERGRQLEEEVRGLEEHLTARDEQLELVSRELGVFRQFLANGLVPRDKLFDLEKERASLKASRSESRADIASTRGKLIELERSAAEVELKHNVEVAKELAAAQQKLTEVEHKLQAARDALERIVIRAPIGGVVVNMQTHTVGGVVSGGDPLLDIVPADGRLIVTAQVDPKDRDAIKVGQAAEVRFSAFNRRSTAPIRGEVMTISADSVAGDLKSAKPEGRHYLTRIKLVDDPDRLVASGLIHPGMQADALIMTGDRTLIGYLFKPIIRSFNRAMRED